MDIEFWWPYADKGNKPRFRKCRVMRSTVLNPEAIQNVTSRDFKTVVKLGSNFSQRTSTSKAFTHLTVESLSNLHTE